jgi:pheromone shutdown protein TraB
MNHHLFEEWLLAEEPLSRDQAEALASHLTTCESCRGLSAAWSEVRHLFQETTFVGPAAGFAGRWQSRLQAQDLYELQNRQRRQSWAIFGITAASAIILFILMLARVVASFDNATELLVYWVGQMTALLSDASLIQQVSFVLIRTGITVVPLSTWMIILSTLIVLFLLWIFSLQRIYFRGGLFNEANH